MMSKHLQFLFIICLGMSACKKKANEPQQCPDGCESRDFLVIDEQPKFSSDAKNIVYIHRDQRADKAGIYTMQASGADNRLVLKGGGLNSPSFSPDGHWIVFSNNANIYKMTKNGDSIQALTSVGRNFYPTWSTDGKWIAYDSDEDSNGMKYIWKINILDLRKQRIAHDPTNGEIRMACWTANNKIVHIRYITGGTSFPEIFSMNSDGTNEKRLTNNNHTDLYPHGSSTGMILYTSQADGGYPAIWKMDLEGNNQQLVKNQAYNASWSPDGRYILYTDCRASNGRIWLMEADGKNTKQLTYSSQF